MVSAKKTGFEDFIALINDVGHIEISLYQDKIATFDICRRPDVEEGQRIFPLKLDVLYLIMVEKGELTIITDYRRFCVGENMMIVLTDKFIVQLVSVSDDFRAHNLLVASDFFRSMVKDVIPVTSDELASLMTNPVVRLEQEEFVLLQDNLEQLRRNIRRDTHAFWSKLVENELANLFLEIRNILQYKLEKDPKKQKTSRREQVIARFFQLLFEHSRTEHEVAFYANKLCVTPVYLLRTVKHTIGKTAIRLIHEMVVADAMALLRKPDMNIQDVSDLMNFPDRETFSKFFKTNAGVYPGEFRKNAIR
jgi:AraC-like DNA-binding protein